MNERRERGVAEGPGGGEEGGEHDGALFEGGEGGGGGGLLTVGSHNFGPRKKVVWVSFTSLLKVLGMR